MSEQEYRARWIKLFNVWPYIVDDNAESVSRAYAVDGTLMVRVIDYKAFQAAQDKIQQLEAQNKIMREVLKEIERCWDISDLSCVRPVVESRMTIGSYTKEIRNDSIAAASIAKAIKALKDAEEVK